MCPRKTVLSKDLRGWVTKIVQKIFVIHGAHLDNLQTGDDGRLDEDQASAVVAHVVSHIISADAFSGELLGLARGYAEPIVWDHEVVGVCRSACLTAW